MDPACVPDVLLYLLILGQFQACAKPPVGFCMVFYNAVAL